MVADLVCERGRARDGVDRDKGRGNVGRIYLDIFQPNKAIQKRLACFQIFYAIELQGVGHFAENAFARLEALGGELINLALGLKITDQHHENWHQQEQQKIRTELLDWWRLDASQCHKNYEDDPGQ